jgi:inosine-uridine nucleoside N-ribohydrolase
MEVEGILVGKGVSKSGSSDASHIHGGDGLGNASNVLAKVKVPKNPLKSSEVITKILKKFPETQVLIFGPMTNVAHYIQQYNSLPISRVIAMG